MTVRVVVADDHAVSLAGIVMILGSHPEIEVVATAGRAERRLRHADSTMWTWSSWTCGCHSSTEPRRLD